MSNNLANTSYLFGNNAAFIEELYLKYLNNPDSVDQEWCDYFSAMGEQDKQAMLVSAGIAHPHKPKVIGVTSQEEQAKKKDVGNINAKIDEELTARSLKVISLVDAYRTYGHLDVQLDPLGLTNPKYHPELDYRAHGLEESDLEKDAFLSGTFGVSYAPIRDIIHYVRSTYSNRIAAEFMHIESPEERSWIQHLLESSGGVVAISQEERLKALSDLMKAETFENYLHTKFPGTKRFSVEGLENTISAVQVLVRESVRAGAREFILGMAHRGRLNTLTNIMGKPFHAMFSEFKGELAFPAELGIPGDVKYHLGASNDIEIEGKKVHMSLAPNPSHLEVVNAIVVGKVRAKQDMLGDAERSQVVGVLIHGDAAFAGQGSVMETLALSQLKGFHTGGTLHIVANNQIGFTTNPVDARSTNYSTDIAKFIGAPIFHVNGDDAEAVVYVSKLAAQYRAKFKKDVVIDVVGYRKYGHNEGDEPFFTQPIMYNAIKDKKDPSRVYAEKLQADGVIAPDYFEMEKAKFKTLLDQEFEKSKEYKPQKADWLEGDWSEFSRADVERVEAKTGVDVAKLKKLGQKLTEVPNDFKINSKIARQLEAKAEMISSGEGIDWATGEALAFATLLDEGYGVRMTGQDVKRGTFSHRHAVLFDQETQNEFIPLNNLSNAQKAKLEIHNSNLSEFGVLGFEYGYSFTHPRVLTIWEAQFGDFANGAQVIIDQYISSAESKWLRMSGLTLQLPHGYEGQGPEHSSARLERFLQLCADDNMAVVYCTTPASLFHVLRRQMVRHFRKPLVMMTPKSLLRHKLAISNLADFDKGKTFEPVLDDVKVAAAAKKVKRVILCSGKVYYDLFERREQLKRLDVALVRLEQIYPFPSKRLAEILKRYCDAEVIWCQEEHKNMGSYSFVEPKIEEVLNSINHVSKRARYVGRAESASPAVGYMKLHTVELEKFLSEAFS